MRQEVVFHTPRVTDRVVAAAVSKQDRTRHVIRVPDAKIVDVETRSQTTRVLAPYGEWVDVVRAIDRKARALLPEWTEKHDIKSGRLAPSVCSTGGSVFFTLKNQPDAGRDALKTVCDITAELSDIKRGSGDDSYRLVWRVLEADFKERDSEEWEEEEDDGVAGDGVQGERAGDSEDLVGDSKHRPEVEEDPVGNSEDRAHVDDDRVEEASESRADRPRGPPTAGLEVRDRGAKLVDISTELHSLAKRIRELEEQ